MTLIKSISGIRGTIGGKVGDGLSPLDVVKFTAAYSTWLQNQFTEKKKLKVVVGRDARISGEMVQNIVLSTLSSMGINVVCIDFATTPTTEIMVTNQNADGGIILTASHNPIQWNALKLLNGKGEFLSATDGEQLLKIAEDESFEFAEVLDLGKINFIDNALDIHIEEVLNLKTVNAEAIKNANFTIAVDGVNSVGGEAVIKLLEKLGVKNNIAINCDNSGHFAHNPEPLPENLKDLSKAVIENSANCGFALDPDGDRLAIISENGEMFGEEYTLVAVADYILSLEKGNTVSNLSSTMALRDVTLEKGGEYFTAAVGEVNVVSEMKKQNAIIGGEGNGGVIYPASHYGRDALVGVALFLSLLAEKQMKCSELRSTYPNYFISKNKIQLTKTTNADVILEQLKEKFSKEDCGIFTIDGVKLQWKSEWVHFRKSNTEPIIRIYAESKNENSANELAQKFITEIENLM